jgi:hypothetical protein
MFAPFFFFFFFFASHRADARARQTAITTLALGAGTAIAGFFVRPPLVRCLPSLPQLNSSLPLKPKPPGHEPRQRSRRQPARLLLRDRSGCPLHVYHHECRLGPTPSGKTESVVPGECRSRKALRCAAEDGGKGRGEWEGGQQEGKGGEEGDQGRRWVGGEEGWNRDLKEQGVWSEATPSRVALLVWSYDVPFSASIAHLV